MDFDEFKRQVTAWRDDSKRGVQEIREQYGEEALMMRYAKGQYHALNRVVDLMEVITDERLNSKNP